MGSFIGHVLPGTLFVIIGLWWTFHVIQEYAIKLKVKGKNRRKQVNASSRSWRHCPSKRLRKIPLEPFFKIFGALVGIIGELLPVGFHLVNEDNEFQKPNKFAHSTMYGFFAFSGLIETLNFYKVTQFSIEAEFTVLALAFGVEGTLFAFHLHGRDMFDVRIHTLLYIIIYMTALLTLLEACLPKFRRELFIARSVLTLTQGTWFWEIAFTIYGPHKWFGNAERDLTEQQLMLDTEVITIGIMWHLLWWLGVLLFCCIATNCLYKCDKLPVCCLRSGEEEKSIGLLNGDSVMPELNDVSDEEEILLKRDTVDNVS